MPITSKIKFIAAGAIIALLAAYFVYSSYDERQLTRTVTTLVADAGARLGKAAEIEPDPASPEAAATQAVLDDHAAAAERNLAKLRALKAAPVRGLADSADEYLHTSVEILRRMAAVYRYRLQLALSAQALREHMVADTRTGPWVAEAIRAKERMDRDFREYRIAAEALAQILDGYSISRRRMAEHVDAALLADDGALESARTRTLAAVKQASAEAATAGRLDAYR